MYEYTKVSRITRIAGHRNLPFPLVDYRYVIRQMEQRTEYHIDSLSEDGFKLPISDVSIGVYYNCLTKFMERAVADGTLDKNTPFMGIVAVDWYDKASQAIRRIVSFDLVSGYNWNEAKEFSVDEPDADDIKFDFNVQARIINECFDAVASFHIAERLGWLNAPISKLLYTVPDSLNYASDEVELKSEYGSLFTIVLSTADNGLINQPLLSILRDAMCDGMYFCFGNPYRPSMR